MKRLTIISLIGLTLLMSACSPTVEASQSSTAAESDVAEESPEGVEESISPELITVTDLLGRDVEVPANVTRVVAIGPGALRLYVYAGNIDYVVGVEEMETGDVAGKPYMLANPDLAALPVIGQGGPNNAPDAEKLLVAEPQVIFSTYASESSAADELQAKTGIPVVALSYGGFGITTIFGEKVQKSLDLIGQITGDTSKSQAAIDIILGAQEDLNARTRDIPEDEKPAVYVGGLGYKGAHGIESAQGEYALLDTINAWNVVDETGASGSVMVDKEQLLEWDPDFIFIDCGGYTLVVEDYQKNPAFYESLSAFANGNVYSQLPYNFYSTNIGTAIADAYFLGKIVYPEKFEDIDPAQKADEIYQDLLGQSVYKQISTSYLEFGKLKFE